MTSTDFGITQRLAEFVSEWPAEAIPAAATDLARVAVSDLIGVALAGRTHRIGATILDYVADQGARPVSGILGGGSTSPELAALANGTFAHAVEFDDINHPMYGHPSCSLVPALFACGEEAGVTFGQVLQCYVIGVEIDAALGRRMMMDHSELGYHTTGTIGTIGAAAAAARLVGLDHDATRHALGIAASRAAGLRVNFGSMTKPLHAGAAAMSGVQAVRLAQRGWDAQEDTIGGPIGFFSAHLGGPRDATDVTAGLGEHWSLLEPAGLAIKPFPSCGATHCAIDAALAARTQLGEDPVESVRLGVSERAVQLLSYDRPTNGNEARFSGPYTVAVALLRGHVGLADFEDAAVADPAVRQLMSRVEMYVDDRHRTATQLPATLRVTSARGRVVECSVELARGKNANPLGEHELQTKFVDCAGPGSDGLWRALRHAGPDTAVAEMMAWTQDGARPAS